MDFKAAGKTVTLYPAERGDAPLIILNSFSGDGRDVVDAMKEIGCGECSLASVGDLNWDHEMSPWYCPPLRQEDSSCTGGADEYLEVLISGILPEIRGKIQGDPAFIGIAGYSLAGLFALYALYQTDVFSRAASMSGSLWYPDFRAYADRHELKRKPDRLYFSVGDKEARTRNHMLRTVQENTEYLVACYRRMGIPAEYELNEGNHFKDAALRSAKGIAALVK